MCEGAGGFGGAIGGSTGILLSVVCAARSLGLPSGLPCLNFWRNRLDFVGNGRLLCCACWGLVVACEVNNDIEVGEVDGQGRGGEVDVEDSLGTPVNSSI